MRTYTIRIRNQRARLWRHTESSHLRDLIGGLSHGRCVQRPPWRLNGSLELSFFLQVTNVSALFPEFVQYRVLSRLITDDRLLRRAESSVIKTRSRQNIANGFGYIRSLFDVSWNVARAYTKSRFACAVRCPNKSRSAGRKDQRGQTMLHQFLSAFHRRQLHT